MIYILSHMSRWDIWYIFHHMRRLDIWYIHYQSAKKLLRHHQAGGIIHSHQVYWTLRSQSVSEWVTDKHCQWSDSGLIINLWTNSFQNMYDMLKVKVDRFARKNFCSPKKCRKTGFFWGHNSGVSWLWEELYAKLLGLGQLLGYPWKIWGITVQTSYWEGRWHQNCGYTSPTRKSVKNGTFL